MAFYGAIEQVLTGWIFDLLPRASGEYEQAKTLHRRDDLRRPGRAAADRLIDCRAMETS